MTQKCQDIDYLNGCLCQDIDYPVTYISVLVPSFIYKFDGRVSNGTKTTQTGY